MPSALSTVTSQSQSARSIGDVAVYTASRQEWAADLANPLVVN